MDKRAPDPLTAIRDRIDDIDRQMHHLLIERSGVIAELIRIKGTSRPGAAFRPEREADMMRRIAARHEGGLPLVTVEHIWREIITTFTAMQSPFAVAAGPAADPMALRDLIRFYFGFSIEVVDLPTVEAAVERVRATGTEVAVVPVATEGRWWHALADAAGPKIFARLPFIDIADRPARLPAYVIGPPLKDDAPPDIAVLAMADAPGLAAAVASHGGRVAAGPDGDLLVELPVAATVDDLAREAGAPPRNVRVLGGFAQPISFVASRTT